MNEIKGGMNALLDVSKLPPLVLPENEVWNVYVTYCMSTSCVYFRIIHDDYNVSIDLRMRFFIFTPTVSVFNLFVFLF